MQLATADENSIVEISPLTKDIESLYKGMNIYYGNKEALPISVENLGMGIRSWAVFSTIKTNINYQTEKFKNADKAFYPLLLVEEPEAHVHPQAQRQLFKDVKSVVGQKIITTHSPYILSQVDLDRIKYVRFVDGKTEC